MRTTLNIDATALEAARQMAARRGQSLGAVVSELILKGLQSEAQLAHRSGFPVFRIQAQDPLARITLKDVRQAEQDA